MISEFALCIPVVALMFLVPVQVQRLWWRQFQLEDRAFSVARSLGAEPGDESDLAALAAARAGAGVTADVTVRRLSAPVAVPFRRPRAVDAVVVRLSVPAGIGFPVPATTICRAEARELRLGVLP